MIFLPKAITIYSRKKARFDYKNNYGYGKLANFQLNIISKINFKTLVIISYTLSKLRSRKITSLESFQVIWPIAIQQIVNS